jgi:hypothetical protein
MKNLLIVFLLFLGLSASAQEVYTSSGKRSYKQKTKKGYDPDRLIVGGGLNAGFGSGYTAVGLSPVVGYRITKSFSAGVGIGYQYFRQFDFEDQGKKWYISSNMIYPSVWARQFLFRNIFASACFEQDFISIKQPGIDVVTGQIQDVASNVTASCLLVGVGLRQPMGGRVSFIGEIMYDVLQQKYSPYYGQPTIRIGILAGL